MRNVLIAQALVLIGVSLLYAWFDSVEHARSAAFGVGIALANGMLIAWRMSRAQRLPDDDASGAMRSFVASAIERFVIVGMLFALGFGALQLSALPMLIGFIAGQSALLLTGMKNSQ